MATADPDLANGLERVRLLQASGRLAEAEHEVASLLARNPHSLEVLLQAGELRLVANDGPGADARWKQAAALAPDEPQVIVLGAWSALECGRPAAAYERGSRLVETHPGDALTAAVMAIAAASIRRVDEAQEWVGRLQAVEPGSARLFTVRAEVGLRLRGVPGGRDAVAAGRAAIDQLLAIDPQDQSAHRLRIRFADQPGAHGRAAEHELSALVAGLRAGVPVHAQVRSAAPRALAPLVLLSWVPLVVVGEAISAGSGRWIAPVGAALAIWLGLFVLVARRRRRVLALIPLLGRPRAVRSATALTLPLGFACIVVGVIVVLAAAPFDAAKAKAWNRGEHPATVWMTRPSPPATTSPSPYRPTTSVTFPPPTTAVGPAIDPSASSPTATRPVATTLPIPDTFPPPTMPPIPVAVQGTVFDEAQGTAEVRFIAAAAAATVLVGMLTVLESLSLRRLAAQGT